jgi:hypothetical protein
MIGRDSRGHWVAQELSGMRGGVFVDRAAALKFAKAESGQGRRVILWVSGILELDTSTVPAAVSNHPLVQSGRRGRLAA